MSRSTPSYSAALMNPSSGAKAPFSRSSRSQSWRGVRSQLFASRARRRASPSAASSRWRPSSFLSCASLDISTSNSGNQRQRPAVPAQPPPIPPPSASPSRACRQPCRPRLARRWPSALPGSTYCPADTRRGAGAALRSRPRSFPRPADRWRRRIAIREQRPFGARTVSVFRRSRVSRAPAIACVIRLREAGTEKRASVSRHR